MPTRLFKEALLIIHSDCVCLLGGRLALGLGWTGEESSSGERLCVEWDQFNSCSCSNLQRLKVKTCSNLTEPEEVLKSDDVKGRLVLALLDSCCKRAFCR